jgi:hypothetical protein
MPTATVPPLRTSLPLTEPQERVLKAVNAVPFSSVQEVWRLVFPKGSLSSARALLREMAGGEDGTDAYLCRVALPTRGNWLRLYVVGSLGVKYLRKIGVEVTWRARSYKVRNYSVSYLRHQHAVAQLLTALHCGECQGYQVIDTLTGYDCLRDPPRTKVVINGQDAEVSVLPDLWVYVEQVATGRGTALWFEVDNNGSEGRKKFQHLLRARLALFRNGYADYFGTSSLLCCYLVTGDAAENHARRKSRLRALCRWTKEVLVEEKRKDWASVFRFAVVEKDIYTTPLWSSPVWYRPYSFHRARLFEAITPIHQGESSC